MSRSFAEWLEEGVRMGYASWSFCASHDAIPMTDSEKALSESGDDPCLISIRVQP